MPVHRDNPVRVFIYDDAVRVHAEGPDRVFKLFRAVYNLALIEFIRQVRKDHRRQFHPDTNIDPVAFGRN